MGLIGKVIGGASGIIGGIFGSSSKKPKTLRGVKGNISTSRFYPKELLQLQFPFVYFEKLENIEKGKFKGVGQEKNYLALPIPNGLAFSDSATFREISVGSLAGAIDVAGIVRGNYSASDVIDNLKKQITGLNTTQGLEAAAVMASKVLPVPESIAKATSFDAKRVTNPYNNMTFEQNEIRNFTFQWKLTARDKADTQAIHNIIKTFQAGIYANGDSDAGARSLTLSFPDPWMIQFIDPNNSHPSGMQYLPKIYSCYLKSFDHNYNEQALLWHKDGSPITINITCSFTETRALTLNDIQAMDLDQLGHILKQAKMDPPIDDRFSNSSIVLPTANEKGSAQPNKSIVQNATEVKLSSNAFNAPVIPAASTSTSFPPFQ